MTKNLASNAVDQKKNRMRELSDFDDYRDILEAAYADQKQNNPSVSLGRLAKKVSLDRSFLSLVLKKKRHLDMRRLGKVAEAFRIPENRMDYFYLSFMNSQLGTADQFNILSSIINTYRYSVRRGISFGSPECLQEGIAEQVDNGGNLSFFLLGLTDFPDFSPDPEWIKSRLCDKSVKSEDIKAAVDYLINRGYFKQDSQGRWRSLSMDFFGNPFESNLGISNSFPFLQGLKSFISAPRAYKPFQLFAMAYSLDEAAIQELNKELDALYAKVKELSARVKNPTHIVSLGSWLYSVARAPERA